jgi:hypothetical protein
MSLRTKLFFAAMVLAPVLAVGTVAAHNGEDHSADDTTSHSDERQVLSENTTLQQRVEKYKAEAKARLDEAQKQRLQLRCKASQGLISSLKGRISGLETSRQQKYTNLVNRLTSLSDKLEAKSIDTATFDTQVAELKTKIEAYHTDLAAYKQAVSDLAEMDCAADADAFKAALESARALRAKVVEDGRSIKDYLNNTIKPTLQSIRQQVAKPETQGEGQ